MSRGLKAVLLVLGFGALSLLMLAAIGWWFVSQAPMRTVEDYRAIDKEGSEFGLQTDDRGCLDQTLARHVAQPDIASSLVHSDFLRACLRKARKTANFCAIAEPRWNWRLSRWAEKPCAEAHGNPSICSNMLIPVDTHCDRLIEQGEWKPHE